MGVYLNPGNAGFRAIRKGTYVDKTELISVVNATLGTKEKLTCVSRPRRFGKSYAAQMLCAYYDRSCDSAQLFEGLAISKKANFTEHLNRYYVLYLDIAWFLFTADSVDETVCHLQREVIAELEEAFPDAIRAGRKSLPLALADINKAEGIRFFIIIDEWDALFREAKEDIDLQNEYIKLLRGLFKGNQTDRMVEAAYMTGILPIKKYGTQSALTDFVEYSMVQPGIMAKYAGFTEQEVENLCEQYHMDFSEARRWYDGYAFEGEISVYSPNSIMKAMKTGTYGTYWTETETYESLKIYIDLDKDGLREAIVQMLGGASISIDTGTFQNDMTNIGGRDDVLTLLVHLGYLTYDAKAKAVSIPNEEVRREFIRAVRSGRRRELAHMLSASEQLLADTLAGNEAAVASAIEAAHRAGTAPLFYNNEQALRSVIRFAYISCVDEFLEIQELPAGTGYADVVYLPRKGSAMPIMVVELKWNRTAEGAIRQIRERNYPEIFAGFGSEILLVGISYDEKTKQHTCRIERMHS